MQRIPLRLASPVIHSQFTSPPCIFSTLPARPQTQVRHAGTRSTPVESRTPETASNPLLDAYERSQKQSSPASPQVQLTRGNISKDSIFHDITDATAPEEVTFKINGEERDKNALQQALDPAPLSRRRWEARKVVQEIRRRGRISKVESLKQTERQSLFKSPYIQTSTKKLGMLARQIAGKTLDEAMLQMRFSKKKNAAKILEALDYARNEAVVRRGMGLGKVARIRDDTGDAGGDNAKLEGGDIPTTASTTPFADVPKYKLASWQLRQQTKSLEESGQSQTIRLKDGKKHRVTDPTAIYIDQAWVGRGIIGHSIEHRGRGRRNLLDHRETSISVLLKEEKTRVREYEERKTREERKQPWTALPNRPITGQHQYPLW